MLTQWLYGSLITISLVLQGCSTFWTKPEPKTLQQRLEDFSTKNWKNKGQVEVYWNKAMVPFVHAEKDEDVPYALGRLQAHLRWGQLEILKRMAQGRLSEMAGPFYLPEFDHVLRLINIKESARLSYEGLKSHHKKWLDRFTQGLNDAMDGARSLPPEFSFFKMKKETWTSVDVMSVSRLAALERFIKDGERSIATIGDGDAFGRNQIWTSLSRSGSNSFVVHGDRAQSGSALIANDPHLGIFAPNVWILAGYQSPNHHAVGLMFPGAPVINIGRNPNIAWGGTYMRTLSSHLFETEDSEVVKSRDERIKIRGWFDKKVKVRETEKGPILTDVDRFKGKIPLALSWVGQKSTDELGAYLDASQSKNWDEFRKAFVNFGVAGLNLTYADQKGNIGYLPAAQLPVLKKPKEYFQLVKSKSNGISGYKKTLDFPYSYNPKKGYLASANNMPFRTNPPLSLVNSQGDRMSRFNERLQNSSQWTVNELKNLQQDTFSQIGFRLKEKFVPILHKALKSKDKGYLSSLKEWDGHYDADSPGPALFEILAWNLAKPIFSRSVANVNLRKTLYQSDMWRDFLWDKWNQMKGEDQEKMLTKAWRQSQNAFAKYKNWGEMHPVTVQSPMGMAPFVGKKFRWKTFPSNGGTTTIHKAAFKPGSKKKKVGYGAQSRHISDMGNLDENYFVLLGGNDGWAGSPAIADQVDLWAEGEYLKVPLSAKGVKETMNFYKHKITLNP